MQERPFSFIRPQAAHPAKGERGGASGTEAAGELRWQRGDSFLCALLLAAALFFALAVRGSVGAGAGPKTLVIWVDGREVRRETLGMGARSFQVQGALGPETVEIQGGKARVATSPCPRRFCVRQGWISRPGQVIVCVPGRLVLKVEASGGAKEYEAILQ